MSRRGFRLVPFVATVLLLGCSDDPTSPSYPSLLGSWSGRLVIELQGEQGEFDIVLSIEVQDQGSWSGELVIEDGSPAPDPVSGTVSTGGVVTMVPDDADPASECPDFSGDSYLQGHVDGDSMALSMEYVCESDVGAISLDMILARS